MTSKKKVGFADLRVGLLVLLSIGILIMMILAISGEINFKKSLVVRTKLIQVDGLRPGTEVRLAGVSIGKVTEVNLLPVSEGATEEKLPNGETVKKLPPSVEVVMNIDPEIDGKPAQERIRSDSKVVLGSVGLLGDKVIDITPGTLAGIPIKDGAEVKGDNEASIKQLVTGASDILYNFNDLSSQVKKIAEDLYAGKGTAGKFIKDEALYRNLNLTVVEAQELVKRMREGDGTVGRLLNDPKLYEEIQATTKRMENLVADISQGKGTFGKLATDDELYNRSTKMLARLDGIADKLENTANRIDRGEGTIGKFINDDSVYRETHQTISNLNKLSARLERGEGSAGRLLQDPELYNNLNTASTEVVKLLYDFRQDPKKYLTIKIRIF